MSGEIRPQLRVVGGNDALVRMTRASREGRWPPLRLVEAEDVQVLVVPVTARASKPASFSRDVPASKRAVWSQALLGGLMVVMLSSVGQAIAAHW
jgi:hypothetical protein